MWAPVSSPSLAWVLECLHLCPSSPENHSFLGVLGPSGPSTGTIMKGSSAFLGLQPTACLSLWDRVGKGCGGGTVQPETVEELSH